MGEQLTAALVAAAVSALVSLAVAMAQLRQGRASHRTQVQQDITAKYDRMVDYRLQRPEILSLARRWNDDCLVKSQYVCNNVTSRLIDQLAMSNAGSTPLCSTIASMSTIVSGLK